MNPVRGKTIVVGVTGGIACFKAAAMVSKLSQAGADVHVIMTESAVRFVQPLTFQALSRNPVHVDLFEERNPQVIAHIDLADRADLVVIAPATANFLGKLANGIADDMLTTVLLATRAPVLIAPAMNVNMYAHPAVQANFRRLFEWGYHFIEPGEGHLACGHVGKGRLEEPESILNVISQFLASREQAQADGDLRGWKVLVTAGATREPVDPVRFLTNRSTGRMGFAVAEAARDRGADVVLVAGPSPLDPPAGVDVVRVESAREMYEAVLSRFEEMDVVVKAAAVADYRPAVVHPHKMKKKEGPLSLQLERNPDILKTLGERKTRQFLVGFAAESENLEEHALKKVKTKNLDLIVANNILQEGAGFAVETNEVTLLDGSGVVCTLPRKSKREVADRLWDEIVKRRNGRD